MSIRRLVIVAVPVGIALTYFLMQSLTVGENPNRQIIAEGELMSEVKRRSFEGLYDTIEAGFPAAYKAHASEIEEIAMDTDLTRFELGSELIEESEEFIMGLRAENLGYLATAGRNPLLNIQRAKLAILKDIADRLDFCARVAKDGLHSLDRFALSMIDRGAYGRWLDATFKAMIIGRDAPEAFEPPNQRDWQVFLGGWVEAEGGKSRAMEAFVARDDGDPSLFCPGATDFTRRLIADTTPSGLRILVDYTSNVVR